MEYPKSGAHCSITYGNLKCYLIKIISDLSNFKQTRKNANCFVDCIIKINRYQRITIKLKTIKSASSSCILFLALPSSNMPPHAQMCVRTELWDVNYNQREE